MSKRWVCACLCFFLMLALGLGSCAPSGEQPAGSMLDVQPEPETTETALSAEVRESVLSAIAADHSLSPESLMVQDARPNSWPDACLGLANPEEVCAQMITPGWEVTVTDGQQVWTYRTDETGEQVRLAS